MRRVAVLRPEAGGSATLARAREIGLEAFALPLFELQSVSWALPDLSGLDALLLTSANAVRHAGAQLASCRNLPAHTVGEATAGAAREGGLNVTSVGEGGVDELLASLPANLRLLHLVGRERRAPIEPRQLIVAVPVYDAVPLPAPDLRSLKDAVALVHSPRAGGRLAELATDRSDTGIAAISPAAAAACGTGWQAIAAADRPDDAALLSLAARMCQEAQPE